MFSLIRNEKGVVLVIALMILALLTVLSLTAVLTTTTDMEISTNYRASQSTFYNTEGSMDIAPGTIRRTISLETDPPSILASLGILDTSAGGKIADNGISDIDENTDVFTSLTDDNDGNGTVDYVESIMGFSAIAPTFKIKLGTQDTDETDVTITRSGPQSLKGFSTGFATGYEGGAMTGRGIYFYVTGTRTGDRNSQSQVQLQYLCVERSGGGCL